MKYTLKAVAQTTGIDVMTLRCLAESGKVAFLGALKTGKRTKYAVEPHGYEAYLKGEAVLDLGKITKEIRSEYN